MTNPKGDTLKGTNYFQKVYYHKLGTPQAEDVLVYEQPDQKDWLFGGTVTDDGNYLIITVFQGTDVKTRVYYKDLKAKDSSGCKAARRFRCCLLLSSVTKERDSGFKQICNRLEAR